MNKDCKKYYGLIEDLIVGEELDEQLAAQIELHISDCAECCNEYELQRQEKEVFAHYLFDFEPPPDSWVNFQVRLVEEDESSPKTTISSANLSRPKKRIFVFGCSPARAAFAALFLFFGIGFVYLRNTIFEKNNFDVAETKPERPLSPLPQFPINNQNPGDLQAKDTINADSDAPKSRAPRVKNDSHKNRETAQRDKKQLVSEVVKIKPKASSSGDGKKIASEDIPDGNVQSGKLRRQKLEAEIAGQIEKIELLLRSFRNLQLTESLVDFDVEYEKQRARKLLETNIALQNDAKNYGISYAEELLSRAEPYLLEIANLENNPAPDRILDIKQRVSSQNIIAGLQVYNSIATQQ